MAEPISKAEFLARARKIHGNQYDYSKVRWVNYSDPVEIKCSVHGSFWQRPKYHILHQCGCTPCALSSLHFTSAEWIQRAKKVHGDTYDYTKTVYKGALGYVNIRCRIHGVFNQKSHNHLNGFGCPKCGIESRSLRLVNHRQAFARTQIVTIRGRKILVSSKSEITVAKLLLSKFKDLKDQRQTPVVPYKFARKQKLHRPDFFIPSQNRIVEVKSTWSLGAVKSNLARNTFTICKRKASAAEALGYKYSVLLVGRKGIIPLPADWLTWTRGEVRRYEASCFRR